MPGLGSEFGPRESSPVTGFFAAVSQVSVVVFLVWSMSEIGLGLRLQKIIAPLRNVRIVDIAKGDVALAVALLPAALLIGKHGPATLNKLDTP